MSMEPLPLIKKILEATTQYYTTVEVENRGDPRRHMQSRLPGLRKNRVDEKVSTYTFFFPRTSDRGNSCS